MNDLNDFLDLLGRMALAASRHGCMILCLGYVFWFIYEIVTAPIIKPDKNDPYQQG